MRFSGSTPNPSPDRPVPLYLVVAHEDHPKLCTGRRLLRRGLVRELNNARPPEPLPLILDPNAETPLSREDRVVAEARGILVVDCSWNQLGRRGGFPSGIRWIARARPRRRLPWLLAGNPQHYGRLAELNTVEAFAAALFTLGESGRAAELLEGFVGQDSVLSLNRDPLAAYERATDAAAVRVAEREFF